MGGPFDSPIPGCGASPSSVKVRCSSFAKQSFVCRCTRRIERRESAGRVLPFCDPFLLWRLFFAFWPTVEGRALALGPPSLSLLLPLPLDSVSLSVSLSPKRFFAWKIQHALLDRLFMPSLSTTFSAQVTDGGGANLNTSRPRSLSHASALGTLAPATVVVSTPAVAAATRAEPENAAILEEAPRGLFHTLVKKSRHYYVCLL